ncbi:hypothetical protein BDZ91DRAFT_791900 [Kalaharituber pfeilii]|nr:hypothetical protein BDZ91DRAFT_791900 [Kalaharituber pfeilii]
MADVETITPLPGSYVAAIDSTIPGAQESGNSNTNLVIFWQGSDRTIYRSPLADKKHITKFHYIPELPEGPTPITATVGSIGFCPPTIRPVPLEQLVYTIAELKSGTGDVDKTASQLLEVSCKCYRTIGIPTADSKLALTSTDFYKTRVVYQIPGGSTVEQDVRGVAYIQFSDLKSDTNMAACGYDGKRYIVYNAVDNHANVLVFRQLKDPNEPPSSGEIIPYLPSVRFNSPLAIVAGPDTITVYYLHNDGSVYGTSRDKNSKWDRSPHLVVSFQNVFKDSKLAAYSCEPYNIVIYQDREPGNYYFSYRETPALVESRLKEDLVYQ